jgi:SAM-dependent methyltransferase
MIMPATFVFDSMASTYDADFTTSGIGKLQRERVWLFLSALLQTKGAALNILEINCGTGEDALQLAALGHQVTATDASAAMIGKAKTKLTDSQTKQLQFVQCSFDELPARFANQQFDLVFSDFGGLNCVDKTALQQLSNTVAALTKEDGDLFFVLMGNCCVWEMFYYGIRGKFSNAVRRLKKKAAFNVNGNNMPVWYYSPRRIKKIFSKQFKFLQQQPVGLFIPPSYLEKKMAAKLLRLQRLDRLEKKFGYSFLSAFADHYCIHLKKINP